MCDTWAARRRRTRVSGAAALTAATMLLAGTSGGGDATNSGGEGGVASALMLLSVPAEDAATLAADSATDPVGDTFRFAAEGSRPATLDAGWTDIQRYGAAVVGWTEPPTIPCGGDLDGAAVVCGGSAVPLAAGVALFWLQAGDALPVTSDLAGNLAVPVLTPGGVPWEADPTFAWDTFQGADRWHQLTTQPGGPWQVDVRQWDGQEIQPVSSDLFAVFAGDVLIVAVPVAEVGLEPVDVDAGDASASSGSDGTVVIAGTIRIELPFGVAIHFHDGSFGQQPDSTSGVDSAPDTDGPARRGPGDLAGPTSGQPVVVEATTDDAAAGEDQTDPDAGTAGGDSSGTTGDDAATGIDDPPPATQPRPPEGDDGDLFVWALLVGLTATGTGVAVATRRRRRSCRCTISLELVGPPVIEKCCWPITARLGAVEDGTDDDQADPGSDERTSDPTRRHLDIDVDGERRWDLKTGAWRDWDFFDTILQAKATVTCRGGGSVDLEQATYEWDLRQEAGAIFVTCTVTAPVSCEDGTERNPVTATAELLIRLHMGECSVTVLLEQNAWSQKSYNHADILIECGSYREVFGWFPRGDVGIGGHAPAYVDRKSGALAKPGDPGLGEIVNQITGFRKAKTHRFTSKDCSKCTNLRRHWEQLYAQSGSFAKEGRGGGSDYWLLTNNCVENVYESLVAGGFVPETGIGVDVDGKGGGKIVIGGDASVGWMMDVEFQRYADGGLHLPPGVEIEIGEGLDG